MIINPIKEDLEVMGDLLKKGELNFMVEKKFTATRYGHGINAIKNNETGKLYDFYRMSFWDVKMIANLLNEVNG